MVCFSVYHNLRYNTSIENPCHNKRCSHLCLLVPGGQRCVCPDSSVNSHRTKTEEICDAAAERPRPEPLVCKCENGGSCREPKPDSEENKLWCECPTGFLGEFCEVHTARSSRPGGANTTAIVVPIVVILLVLGAATGVWFFIRKRPL